jgi:hypothetical protein
MITSAALMAYDHDATFIEVVTDKSDTDFVMERETPLHAIKARTETNMVADNGQRNKRTVSNCTGPDMYPRRAEGPYWHVSSVQIF